VKQYICNQSAKNSVAEGSLKVNAYGKQQINYIHKNLINKRNRKHIHHEFEKEVQNVIRYAFKLT
jgi:hypothetical protein